MTALESHDLGEHSNDNYDTSVVNDITADATAVETDLVEVDSEDHNQFDLSVKNNYRDIMWEIFNVIIKISRFLEFYYRKDNVRNKPDITNFDTFRLGQHALQQNKMNL